jgi:nucleoid-associated protein YgaU
MVARHTRARSRKTDSKEEQSDAASKQGGSERSRRVDRADNHYRGRIEYEPEPDPRALGERYGIDVGQREAGRLQRLEVEFGSEQVRRWAGEGMPVAAMGKPRDMQAFRAQRSDGPDVAVQPKLEMSSPGGPAEREAERVAEQVMEMDVPSVQTAEPHRGEKRTNRQRRGDNVVRTASSTRSIDGTVPAENDSTVRSAVRGGGRPLLSRTRSYFEPRFGADFSDVRVHTGSEADEAARSINAEAFTVGSDVAFSKGKYDPETDDGKELIAHELAHVLQQDGGISRSSQKVQRQATAQNTGQFITTHEVKRGDTLWDIAEEYYGDGSQYPKIQQATERLSPGQSHIEPGWELVIPDISGSPEPDTREGTDPESESGTDERGGESCPTTWDEGEIERSRSEPVKIESANDISVSLTSEAKTIINRGQNSWIVYDFGVGRAKPSKLDHRDLQPVFERRTVPTLYRRAFRAFGVTDCIGRDIENAPIRRERGARVTDSLRAAKDDSNAKIIQSEPIAVGKYLAPNSSQEGRAINRGVLIVDLNVLTERDKEEEDEEVDPGVVKEAMQELKRSADEGNKVDEKYFQILKYYKDDTKDWEIMSRVGMKEYFREVRSYDGPENNWPEFRDNMTNGREYLRLELDGDEDTDDVRDSIDIVIKDIRDAIRYLKENFQGQYPNPYYGPRNLRDYINKKYEDPDSIYYVYLNYGGESL